ncbi:putative membrane protein [Paenibacillus larvae subsp. larvae]|uniref:Uncharacterized protein n=2 Tax=Paenibacillus larvae TaxID=1464 RepID=A0A1V0USK3_9BACL|nr:DUF421 domain-containing protein [Paenibacillus larvae]AQT84700.1 hypothetical protein B1222_10330 [Paenibacillus larvae subsp. pulvifaciens]AQZ46699.1 hypothetical protein B5S25_08815 [Paenibacillus larvae subsp. pulvifaciens]ARF68107.1 hypothetical protein B7C51_10100 [Paenibacillus larvae subsp. pulvifaciens]AVF28447.1 putative membrane protein [Paenibacillus larvae subsp. larvae]AVF32950.1 putative membrane protein [Paenibacillus larvae subsp. larvae]
MNEYIDILLRTISALIIILLIARLLGKQTISNMTFHDFATGITMGAIAANLAFNVKMPALHIILCLAVFAITSLILSWLPLKSKKARKWISGSPTVVIEKGKILEDNMKKIKYSLDSLIQSLREKDIFDIDEVEYAILETNGKISVKKKPEYKTVTMKDLKLPYSLKSSFPVELIMDGEIQEDNLAVHGITKEWLTSQLSKKGKKVSDVFYAVKSTKGNLIIDYYKDHLASPIDKE